MQPLLAATANPEAPNQVDVSQPSQALVGRADAQSALNGLFLGLGAVALLVGAVGVANIMIISVLERRSEIGLRRALGATKGHIRIQFLAEAVLLALAGGVAGVAAGDAGHRGVRLRQGLGGRGARARLGRWARRGRRDRRRCRPAASAACGAHVADGGALVDVMGSRAGGAAAVLGRHRRLRLANVTEAGLPARRSHGGGSDAAIDRWPADRYRDVQTDVGIMRLAAGELLVSLTDADLTRLLRLGVGFRLGLDPCQQPSHIIIGPLDAEQWRVVGAAAP